MHYYKRNIGDYSKKAARLTMLQHGAYTLLMDSCYDRERFPTRDEAIDWLWASSKEEIEAVDFVLRKFFELQDDGTYVQPRIQQEVENYKKNSATNKRIAQEREQKRREERAASTNRAPVVNEPPPNQEPRTINQEPLNKTLSLDEPNENGVDQKSTQAKKKAYPSDFEVFWKTALTEYKRAGDSPGNKSEAFAAWKKLNPDEPQVISMLQRLNEQATVRERANRAGQRIDSFKHVCRWIKTCGWEDVVTPRTGYNSGFPRPDQIVNPGRSALQPFVQ